MNFTKKISTMLVIASMAAIMVVSAMAAPTYTSTVEAVAGLTGRTIESVQNERIETGKTYGTIANEAGKLTEFKTEIYEQRKQELDNQVADKLITQSQADQILENIKTNQANCNGTGCGYHDNCILGTGTCPNNSVCGTNGGLCGNSNIGIRYSNGMGRHHNGGGRHGGCRN